MKSHVSGIGKLNAVVIYDHTEHPGNIITTSYDAVEVCAVLHSYSFSKSILNESCTSIDENQIETFDNARDGMSLRASLIYICTSLRGAVSARRIRAVPGSARWSDLYSLT